MLRLNVLTLRPRHHQDKYKAGSYLDLGFVFPPQPCWLQWLQFLQFSVGLQLLIPKSLWENLASTSHHSHQRQAAVSQKVSEVKCFAITSSESRCWSSHPSNDAADVMCHSLPLPALRFKDERCIWMAIYIYISIYHMYSCIKINMNTKN